MTTILVSVLMATRNRASFLEESIESVLSQDYEHWELLIVDDASTDETPALLQDYAKKDARIRIVHNESNIGLTKSLNKALAMARGVYIARLDDKDLADPRRLRLQVEFLESHPAVALVGSWVLKTREGGTSYVKKLPTQQGEIKRALIFFNPFVHSAIMMRKSALDAVGGYDEGWLYAQDYELYFRLAHLYDLANLPLPLVRSRHAPHSITRTKNREQALFALKARQKALREGLYPRSLRAFIGLAWGYGSVIVPVSFRRLLKRS